MRRQFALFCVAGALAFVVDASVVQLLVRGVGVDPLLARLPSFAAAVTATWWFNRRYTFVPRHDLGPHGEFVRYVATQLGGLTLNYLAYALLVLNLPLARQWPVLGVALGSCVGLGFNFVSARKLVFGPARDDNAAPDPSVATTRLQPGSNPVEQLRLTFNLSLALSVGLPLLVLLALGQDCNWDLRNYHLYNPHAWWTGRHELDIAPAQLQTWHNPLLDLPLYGLDRAGASGLLVSLWLLLPAMVSIRLLLAISDRLAGDEPSALRLVLVAAVAVSGAAATIEMGSSHNDWFVAAAVLAAIHVLLSDSRGQRAWPPLVAGLCLGVMTGLKLTAAPYCIAIAAATFATGLGMGWSSLARRLLLLAIGGLAGFLLAYGYWAAFLYERFGNPFFPYFNQWFQSPHALPEPWNDTRFLSGSWRKSLLTPLRLLRPTTAHSEQLLSDPRLLLGLVASVFLLSRAAAEVAENRRNARIFLAVFIITAAALWVATFGIYRYLLPVEVLSAVVLIHALLLAWHSRPGPMLAAIAATFLVALTHVQNLERQPFGTSLSEFQKAPELAAGDMVVTASGDPMAFTAVVMPDDVPIIGLSNHLMRPGVCTRLQQQAEAAIAGHRGRLWLLSTKRAGGSEVVPGQGLVANEPCQDFASRYGMLYLCTLDASAMVRQCPGP